VRGTNPQPTSIPPIFTPDALPATTLPIYPGLGQAPNMLACIPSGLVMSHSCVLDKNETLFYCCDLSLVFRYCICFHLCLKIYPDFHANSSWANDRFERSRMLSVVVDCLYSEFFSVCDAEAAQCRNAGNASKDTWSCRLYCTTLSGCCLYLTNSTAVLTADSCIAFIVSGRFFLNFLCLLVFVFSFFLISFYCAMPC